MEIGHRPPPGVAPRPCPAPAAPALLFLSLRAGAGLQAGPACGAACGLRGTGSGVSWTREQGPRNTVRSGRRKSHRVALASARWRPPRIPAPRPRPRPRALTDVSILIVVIFQLHVQQNVPTHLLHVSPIPALGSARRCSAPLGSGRKLRSAL